MSQQSMVVVGGGVMGISSALRLLESGFSDVTLITDKFDGITSKTSPAVFRPDWLGDTPAEKTITWGNETKAHLGRVWRETGSDAGVTATTHLEVYKREAARDPGSILPKVMDGFRALTPSELAIHCPTALGGWHYSTFMVEGSRYLPYLLKRAVASGLRVIQKQVEGEICSVEFWRNAICIAQRPTCRIVVNTTGLKGGIDTHPVRGQLVMVKAPYVQMAMGEYNPENHDFPTYIYPRRDHIVLGSTYLEDVGDKEVDDETTEHIIERCAEFIPQLRTAPILAEVVCIRPGRRAGVRLDRVKVGEFDVVNCFGHGGAGHSLSWGCAGNVLQLVKESVAQAKARL